MVEMYGRCDGKVCSTGRETSRTAKSQTATLLTRRITMYSLKTLAAALIAAASFLYFTAANALPPNCLPDDYECEE